MNTILILSLVKPALPSFKWAKVGGGQVGFVIRLLFKAENYLSVEYKTVRISDKKTL